MRSVLDALHAGDRLLILSPHLDDAVLSVGGIMDRATKSGVAVIAGTIFTADADEAVASSPRVRELHALWGLGDNPSRLRREEDVAAVRSLGGDYLHANLPDAIYRMDVGGRALYPTTQAVFSDPSPNETVWRPLRRVLEQWLARLAPRVVLCPLTVGRHVDHVVTADAFRSIWQGAPDLWLYEDMPYAAGFAPAGARDSVDAALARSRWAVGKSVDIAVDTAAKAAAIEQYSSQLSELFPGGRVRESVDRSLERESAAGPHERLWRVD